MEEFVGFQLKNLGDVLMTIPALALIKKYRPKSRLVMVVRPQTAPLLENHPLVDEVIAHQFQPRAFDWRNSRRLAQYLRKKEPVASFHFDGQQRGGILAFWARLPVRAVGLGILGVGGLKSSWLYNKKANLKPKDGSWESLALSHQRLVAEVLGVEPEPDIDPPKISLPQSSKDKAKALLETWPGTGPIVGLTLRGRQKEKSWPLDYWAQVMEILRREKNARFYVTGEKDDAVLAKSLASLGSVDLANFCGQTDLLEFVALAAASDLFLTIDTGSAHLVSLTSTPLATIFTATNPLQWGALSRKQAIICYNWALARFGLLKGSFVGYPVIRPEEVAKVAASLLA
ncbi:MAG: hypothetical protein LBT38_07345 [Deltaproteobacteria bacterium]|nr:hypothetical protein [Deltaproteobacteria bacterium]